MIAGVLGPQTRGGAAPTHDRAGHVRERLQVHPGLWKAQRLAAAPELGDRARRWPVRVSSQRSSSINQNCPSNGVRWVNVYLRLYIRPHLLVRLRRAIAKRNFYPVVLEYMSFDLTPLASPINQPARTVLKVRLPRDGSPLINCNENLTEGTVGDNLVSLFRARITETCARVRSSFGPFNGPT